MYTITVEIEIHEGNECLNCPFKQKYIPTGEWSCNIFKQGLSSIKQMSLGTRGHIYKCSQCLAAGNNR